MSRLAAFVAHPLVRFLLPALATGGISLAAFMQPGATPFVRAAGLALVVAAMTLTLRRLGWALAVSGALALAFSPAFWSQTGGDPSGTPVMALVLVTAAGVWLLTRRFGARAFLLVEIGVLVATAIFWNDFTYYKSLRITTLCAALLLYLLMDGLFRSGKRPDDAPSSPPDEFHTLGILLLLTVGVINEPLVVLFAPSVLVGLWLTRAPLPLWYGGLLAVALGIGGFGVLREYVDPQWWTFPAAQASALTVPYLLADGWREPLRWVQMITLLAGQFSPPGIALAVIGLARLARWYPSLGVVTLLAYGAYGIFGLMYFGKDATVLLLPMLMIQLLWMTYAAYAFGQWLVKASARPRLRWAAAAVFALLPLALLARVAGIG